MGWEQSGTAVVTEKPQQRGLPRWGVYTLLGSELWKAPRGWWCVGEPLPGGMGALGPEQGWGGGVSLVGTAWEESTPTRAPQNLTGGCQHPGLLGNTVGSEWLEGGGGWLNETWESHTELMQSLYNGEQS